MVNALFDQGRREKLRNAVKKGDLSSALRKPLQEDLATTQVFERQRLEAPAPASPARAIPPGSLPAWDPKKIEQSQVLAVGFQNLNPIDQGLFDAIKAGDAAKVMDAINLGANLNSRHQHMPRHRAGDCILVSSTSPLEYAKKKGDPVIIELLERYGAKD